MNQLVVYGGGAALQQLPKALRAAVASARTVGAAVALIKKSGWYLAQANAARKQIISAFTSAAGSSGQRPNSGAQRNVIPREVSTKAAYNRGSVAGSIVQTHREYVMDVSPTSAAFELTRFSISPSDRILFKSLAYISRCFDKYRFRRLTFVYVPSCASTTGGRVAGAFEYDLNDAAPASKVDLYAMEGSKRCAFYDQTRFDMMATGWLDVSLTGSEPKLSCPGLFYFASMECDSTGVKGELYVEYEVELKIATKFVPPAQRLLLANASGLISASGHTLSGETIATVSGQTLIFSMDGVFSVTMSVVNTALGTLSGTATSGCSFFSVRNAQSASASVWTANVTAVKGAVMTLTVGSSTSSVVTVTITETYNY